MRPRNTLRTVHWISGTAAAALLAASGLTSLAPESSLLLPDWFIPAPSAVLGVLSSWVHLSTTQGYRRAPFYLAALSGTVVVLSGVRFSRPEIIVLLAFLQIQIHTGVAVITGLICFVAARVVMKLQVLNARTFMTVFVVILSAVLILSGVTPWIPEAEDDRIVYQGELDHLIRLLHPSYRNYQDEVEEFLEDLAADGTLSTEEQERLIRELNERIAGLEAEMERFEVVEAEKLAYAEEVARLQKQIEEVENSGISPEDLKPVSSYREAVRPAVPLVRDFAVRLAAEYPGSYYRAPRSTMPSREGMLQVLTIHRYVAARWKYLNDPLFIRGNYYSPADRTIAAGLAGDCDDFAILLASLVEAIGGRVRILHGVCPEGAHAWAEVYIGNETAWREAQRILSSRFPGRRIFWITPRHGNDYWLGLDWQVGMYSCGASPTLQYESR